MPYSLGPIINRNDFNTVRNLVDAAIGPNSAGYGVESLATVPVTNRWRVASDHWKIIVNALDAAHYHQLGTRLQYSGQNAIEYVLAPNKINGVSTGTLVDNAFVAAMISAAETYCVAPQTYLVHSGQLSSRQNENGVSSRTTVWSGTIEHVVSVSWLTTSTAQYFFNLGGYISLNASHLNNASGGENDAWKAIIAAIPSQTYTRSDYVNASDIKNYTPVNGSGAYVSHQYSVIATRSSDSRSIVFRVKLTDTADVTASTSMLVLPSSAVFTIPAVAAGSFTPSSSLPNSGSYTDESSGNNTITLSVNSDGGFVIASTGQGANLSSQWGTPIVAGAGSNYWVRFTLQNNQSSGSGSTSPSTGWLNLASNRLITISSSVSNGVQGSQDSTYFIEISSNSAGTSIVSSGTYIFRSLAKTTLFSPVSTLPGSGDTYQELDIGDITMEMTFQPDGTFKIRSLTTINAGTAITEYYSSNWGNPTSSGAGASYAIRFTASDPVQSGVGSSSFTESTGWVSLASAQTVSVTASSSSASSNRAQQATYLVEISNSSGSVTYGSGTFILKSTSARSSFYDSGGGCVALESYVPLIETDMTHNGNKIDRAWMLEKGMKISLGTEDLDIVEGQVVNTLIEYQPCLRIVTSGGASLVCSTTAKIYTKDHGFIRSPELLGKSVAVLRNDQTDYESVVELVDMGMKFVRVIDAGDNSFWAGETPDSFILHHNAIIDPVTKESLK